MFYSGHNHFLFIRTRDFEAARDTLRREVQVMDNNRALFEPSTLVEQTQVDSVGDGTPGTVTIGGNIQGTFYNCADDEIYFCHYHLS